MIITAQSRNNYTNSVGSGNSYPVVAGALSGGVASIAHEACNGNDSLTTSLVRTLCSTGLGAGAGKIAQSCNFDDKSSTCAAITVGLVSSVAFRRLFSTKEVSTSSQSTRSPRHKNASNILDKILINAIIHGCQATHQSLLQSDQKIISTPILLYTSFFSGYNLARIDNLFNTDPALFSLPEHVEISRSLKLYPSTPDDDKTYLERSLLNELKNDATFSEIMAICSFNDKALGSICHKVPSGSQISDSTYFPAKLLKAFVVELLKDPEAFLKKLHENEKKWGVFSTFAKRWLGYVKSNDKMVPAIDELKECSSDLSKPDLEDKNMIITRAIQFVKEGIGTSLCNDRIDRNEDPNPFIQSLHKLIDDSQKKSNG